MKDTVGWIDYIPDGWNIMKFRQLITRISTGLNPRDNFKLTKDDNLYYVTIRNFKDGKLYLDDKCDRISYESWKIIQERSDLHKGDILFASISKDGQAYLLKEEPASWNVNESVFCIRVNKKYMDARYFTYEITSTRYYDDLRMDATGTTFKSIKQNNLKQSRLLVPPISEQQAIADYLDEKCSKIDEIIAESKASIDEYKKLKQSVITNITTHGLGDVSLINSGNMDIGMIPDTWNICKTLYGLAMPITDGPHVTPELLDDGIAFISAEAVSCGRGSIDFNHMRGYISEEFYNECCKKYVPQRDDIYMIKSGATTGTVSIVDTDRKFTIWSPLAVFRVNRDRLNPRYLFYFLQSKPYQQQVQLGWTFGTQQNIGMRTLEQLKICLPPLGEQAEIVEYLDNKLPQIDSLIAEKESLIKDLEAYKKSLIYEVVTGKRRVV